MSEFKVGDRVKIPWPYSVDFGNRDTKLFGEVELELIEPEFKIGDRVTVTDGSAAREAYSAQVSTGWSGVVCAFEDSGVRYRVVFDEDPCQDDYGWWMSAKHLRLDQELTTNDPDPVDTALAFEPDAVTLDPSDPFEQVLISMVETNRKKRADYAVDGSPWSNFEFTASVLGIDPADAAVHNVAQKLARLSSLRANGRTDQTANEAVDDTYLDLAVYAVIALAIRTHPSGKVESA